MKRISTVEKCEKNFWMHGVSVVTKCPECNFHFGVSAGYQFEGGKCARSII